MRICIYIQYYINSLSQYINSLLQFIYEYSFLNTDTHVRIFLYIYTCIHTQTCVYVIYRCGTLIDEMTNWFSTLVRNLESILPLNRLCFTL